MTTCKQSRGFTLLELVVVLAVLALIAGTAVPLAGAVVVADKRDQATQDLEQLATALDAYYFDNAAFPTSLTASDFFGVYFQPGIGGGAVVDPFTMNLNYVYAVDTATNFATVHSRGENGTDEGAAAEELSVFVYGAVPGGRHTWMKLRIAVEVLANFIESGGNVGGSWIGVCSRMGLDPTYRTDGFGTTFDWDDSSYALRSAGPDKTLNTADDIEI
jgi:prepilin-type N-terminal cleavage/methylation domain-containing protein